MAKLNFLGGKAQFFDDQGNVLSGGKAYFYEIGSTTLKDTYTDSTLSTVNTNPVELDSSGRGTIWLNGDYKVVVKNSSGVTIYTEDNLNPSTASVTGTYNLLENPSFEDDTDSDLVPDSWDLVEYTGSTNVIDNSDQNHGVNSMKFTSTGSGGGYITTNSFFAVDDLTVLDWAFDLKCSVVDVRVLVQILWYDSSKTALGSPTSDLYDEDAANPTSWTRNTGIVTVPDTASFAKLLIYGCHSSDATSGSCWIDNTIVTVAPLEGKAPDVASAAAVTPTGRFFDITGTTTITSIADMAIGTKVSVQFDDALTVTHHATNLILPNGVNITTEAGATAEFIQYATGDWLMTNYSTIRDASTANKGLVELTTDAEFAAGTDSTRAVTTEAIFSELGKSHAADGYQKFPNGLIFQWGDNTVTANTNVAVTFPIEFPTAFLNAGCTRIASVDVSDYIVINSATTTGMNLRADAISGSAYWYALGY